MKVEVIKAKKEEVKTVFTHYQDGLCGWNTTHRNPNSRMNVMYLGHCITDGDMFSSLSDAGVIAVYKGTRGSEFDDPNNIKFIDNVTVKKEGEVFNADMLKEGELMVINMVNHAYNNHILMRTSEGFVILNDGCMCEGFGHLTGHKIEKGDKVILTAD